MEIKTKDGTYNVYENESSWTLKKALGKIDLKATVSKKDCPNFEELKAFIEKSCSE